MGKVKSAFDDLVWCSWIYILAFFLVLAVPLAFILHVMLNLVLQLFCGII